MTCDVYQPRYQDGCDQCGRPSATHPRVFVPTDPFGPPASRPNPDYQPDGHDIRLLPSDPAKTHAVRDEWRTECSCGWAGPPDAGQGPAAEHWLNHMRALTELEGADDGPAE